MGKLLLDRGNFTDFTSVSNLFIDEYMPKANGEFVKIYLYLLRLVSSNSSEISTDSLADILNFTENDVVRGLNYWENLGLISLTRDADMHITGIRLETFTSNRFYVKSLVNSANSQVCAMAVGDNLFRNNINNRSEDCLVEDTLTQSATAADTLPVKHKYTSKELSSFGKDSRVQQLTFLAQTYLGKTLNSADINSILYMLDGLKLSSDFIEYIMEMCISSGNKTLSSIERTAVNYYKRGITTIDDVKFDNKIRKSIYKSVFKIFGLAEKTAAKKDVSYITKWTEDYGFSEDIILEACNRTMEHTHTASFPYADSILKGWHNKGISDLEHIEELDKVHAEEVSKKFTSITPPKSRTRSCSASLKKFKNMEERTYNSVELEKMLLSSNGKHKD